MKNIFKPFNKHVLVELIEESVENNGQFFVPEEYRIKEYSLATISEFSHDCQFIGDKDYDKTVVFLTHMKRTLKIEGQEFFIIPENSILGTYMEETKNG